jgi:hypothetical protein
VDDSRSVATVDSRPQGRALLLKVHLDLRSLALPSPSRGPPAPGGDPRGVTGEPLLLVQVCEHPERKSRAGGRRGDQGVVGCDRARPARESESVPSGPTVSRRELEPRSTRELTTWAAPLGSSALGGTLAQDFVARNLPWQILFSCASCRMKLISPPSACISSMSKLIRLRASYVNCMLSMFR